MKSMFEPGARISRPFRDIKVEPTAQLEPLTETAFFESAAGVDSMLEAVSKLADQTQRKDAAAVVVQWIDGGDADFDELDAMLFGMVADDEDGEVDLNDTQYEAYEQLSDYAAEFIKAVSNADDADIEMMGDDEDSAERVYNAVESALGDIDADEAIAEFAVREHLMLESVRKVIRNGETKFIKKRQRKRRMSPAQKAALRKARQKSQTGAAKAARKKSRHKGESRGLYKRKS